MDEPLIKVQSVSKKFCRDLKTSLWYGATDLFHEMTARRGVHHDRLREKEFWAVDDVSFTVRRGECLALIGPNGSGKSTLLKMINGLIKPDRGQIRIAGRVGALIELGAGFNPILTGRENIQINGSVLGLSRREIEKKLDAIIDFAEIGEFIDAPVQSYSSGMKVRLGFAVAAQMEPDVLLIDEVLAVGDAGFRSKCYNAISCLAEKSAVLFVSHAMHHVSRLAAQTLVLNKGNAQFLGSTGAAVNKYYRLFEKDEESVRFGDGRAKIESIEFLNKEDRVTYSFEYGAPLRAKLRIYSNTDLDSVIVDLVFRNVDDTVTAECNNYINPVPISLSSQQSLHIEVSIDKLTLNPGVYKLSALLNSDDMVTHYDWMQNFTTIEVKGDRIGVAGQQFQADWSLREMRHGPDGSSKSE